MHANLGISLIKHKLGSLSLDYAVQPRFIYCLDLTVVKMKSMHIIL